MEETQKCQYLSITDIQKEYLPISRKKLRIFVKRYLDAKMIGNRIFVSREELEEAGADFVADSVEAVRNIVFLNAAKN